MGFLNSGFKVYFTDVKGKPHFNCLRQHFTVEKLDFSVVKW